MKRLLTAIFLLGTVAATNAQYQFIKQWDKRYGSISEEGLFGLNMTSDSFFVLSGYSNGGINGDKTQDCRGSNDYWIVKFDGSGDKIWDRRFGGDHADGLHATVAAKDGGVVLAGYSDSNISGDVSQANRGGGDYWIVKVDAEGNKVWDKRYGGNRSDNVWCAIGTSDGGYLIGGESNSDAGFEKTEDAWGGMSVDYWVVKIDSAGNKEWDKTLGGIAYDQALALGQTQDGGYIVSGVSYSEIGGDVTEAGFGETDIWLVKLNSDGQLLWDKKYGGSSHESLFFIAQISENRMLLLGNTVSPADGNRTVSKTGHWLIEIDSIGTPLEQFAYNGAAGISSLQITADNGYLISGGSERSDLVIGAIEDRTEDCLGRRNVWLLKLDSNFNKQWDKIIFTTGEEWYGYSLETPEGCYVVATQSRAGIGGYKTQAAWDSSYDYFVVKFCMEKINSIQPNTDGGVSVQVYPNPFTEEVSIALQNSEIHEATFTLTDINGKILYNKEEDHLALGYTKVLDLRQLPTGVYFVTVQTAQGQVVKRVVKE